jgi:2-succinyl-6-hydroxy-2,4-cyclohexadiene-1-carboxylate synthase
VEVTTTIVFFHGLFGQESDWDAVRAFLPSSLLSLCVSIPGHCSSTPLPNDSRDPWSLINQKYYELLAPITNPLLCGYSMGGRIVYSLLATYPEVFKTAVILSAHPGLTHERERSERIIQDTLLAEEVLGCGLTSSFLIRWYSQPIFRSLLFRPQLLASLCEPRPHHVPASLATTIRQLSLGFQPSFFSQLLISCPRLLLLAGQDDPRYVEIGQRLASSLPAARAFIVRGVGHMLHREAPEEIASHIASFAHSINL